MNSKYLEDPKYRETIENIKQLQNDCISEWEKWNPKQEINLEISINFDFYTADKDGALKFEKQLKDENYSVLINTKRTLMFFKGYEINASLEKSWSFEEFKQSIWDIGIQARSFNCLLEGYGAFVDNK